MRRIALLTSLSFALSATAIAGKKKKKKGNEPEPAPTAEQAPEIPSDGTSKKFAKSLLANPMRNFNPLDHLSYGALTFKGDNTWSADGTVVLGVEEDTCTETGSWKMEPAEADNSAVVSWVVIHSDCVGTPRRGVELRALLTLEKDGTYGVKMR
jgi:hypothetical protein